MEENQSDSKEKKHYKSVDDWYKDIGYLKWPIIFFVILILVLIILIDLKII